MQECQDFRAQRVIEGSPDWTVVKVNRDLAVTKVRPDYQGLPDPKDQW